MKLTNKQRETVLKLYRQGYDMTDIGHRFGLTRAAILHIVKKRSQKKRRKEKRWGEEEVANLVEFLAFQHMAKKRGNSSYKGRTIPGSVRDYGRRTGRTPGSILGKIHRDKLWEVAYNTSTKLMYSRASWNEDKR
jgi:hypothetical protein